VYKTSPIIVQWVIPYDLHGSGGSSTRGRGKVLEHKQGGSCLCEEQKKERLVSFLGIRRSE